jgi:hypothetical protein
MWRRSDAYEVERYIKPAVVAGLFFAPFDGTSLILFRGPWLSWHKKAATFPKKCCSGYI